MIKSVTGQQIYEAMKENGLEQIREEYMVVDPNTGKPTMGCLLTQAAVNLDTIPTSTSGTPYFAYSASDEDDSAREWLDNKESWDDEYPNSLLGALNSVLVKPDNKWYMKDYAVSENKLGDIMVRWYDQTNPEFDYDESGEPVDASMNYYLLGTYEEALEMAKDLLTPYWDKFFDIDVREWTFG